MTDGTQWGTVRCMNGDDDVDTRAVDEVSAERLRVERLEVGPSPGSTASRSTTSEATTSGSTTAGSAGPFPDGSGKEASGPADQPAGDKPRFSVKDVAGDLIRLRKGRGLQSPDLAGKIGPALAAALDLAPGQPDAELRRLARSGIVEAAQELSSDLRAAVLVSLAVDGWSDVPLLKDRIIAVAKSMDRDARTARRRLEAGIQQLADALLVRSSPGTGKNPFAPSGWYVDSLASTVRLDGVAARLTEDRVIVAEVDGLSFVTAALSVPPQVPGAPLTVDLVAESGCEIRSSEQVSQSHWLYTLALPRPLRAGDRHRYAVSFSVDRDLVQPYYVLVPHRRTRRFSAELHFASPSDVALVWRLDGVPSSVLYDAEPTPTLLRPDDAGVLRVGFEPLVQGLCYGVQWRWA
jgi:hypothetical protein